MQVDNAIVKSIINHEETAQSPLYECYGPNTDLLHSEVVIAKGGQINGSVPPELNMTNPKSIMTKEMWLKAQKQDPVLNQVMALMKSKTLGHRNHHKNESPELKSMLRIKNQLVLRKGILSRKMKKGNNERYVLEFVAPRDYRNKVLKACHDDVGHAGIWKCTRLFYWANINQDIEQHLKRCERCLRFKAKQELVPLENTEASYPMELVHMDYLTIELKILVVTDHFTRLAQAFVTSSQTTSVVAKTLWYKLFMYYWVPEKILSDQDRNFESSLIMELCKLTGVKKLGLQNTNKWAM